MTQPLNDTRHQILSRIRSSLGVTGKESHRLRAVEDRLTYAPKGVIPARGQGDKNERLHIFLARLEAANATYETLSNLDTLPRRIGIYARERNLPIRLRLGNAPQFRSLIWQTIELQYGASDGSDTMTLSHAFCGVAETGTLILTSGSDNPTTLNFLPEHHLVVLNASDIESDYESAWSRIEQTFGKGEMPRTVNWITGPSRSADIEQTLLLGAHGPRALHVFVVG
jgi:L-lactate dehydrogenase complex protein LldG